MEFGLWIIGFITILSSYINCETIIHLKVELDQSSCEGFKASHNPIQLIEVVSERLHESENVDVLATCYTHCGYEPVTICGGKNTTYNLMFKVSNTVRMDRLLKPVSTVSDPHGFTCAKIETGSDDTCVPYGVIKPFVGPRRWMPSTSASSSSSSKSSQDSTPDSPGKSNTPLIAGIVGGVAAAAGLLAGSTLLYRKLRKNNSVSDESDTTGILGTPIAPFGEAPNSVAPAGTS